MGRMQQRGITMPGGIRVGGGRTGVLLGRAGAAALTYLFRDDFNTDAAAPLASPRTAVPGPGTLTITDTNNKLSVASGKLSFATGGVASGNPGAWGAQLPRVAGRALVAKASATGNGLDVGWDDNQADTIASAIRFTAGGSANLIRSNAVNIAMETIVSGTEYSVCAILRSAGWFAFIKGGVFTNWTLIWVGTEATGSVYPGVSAGGATSIGLADNLHVLDLPTPFDTDYGLATQRLAGARSAADTFTHTADCVIEFTATTIDSGNGIFVRFRKQDANNYWDVRIVNSGGGSNDIVLREIVAGTPTTRSTASTVVASGHRVVIVADGTTIRGYSNNVLRWTYSSASNFATATAGELNSLGTGGAVSDIVSWPRVLGAAPAALLDLAIA